MIIDGKRNMSFDSHLSQLHQKSPSGCALCVHGVAFSVPHTFPRYRHNQQILSPFANNFRLKPPFLATSRSAQHHGLLWRMQADRSKQTFSSKAAAAAAAAAAVAVNNSVSSKRVPAPSISAKSFIAREKLSSVPTDPDGLPLSYDQASIERYWQRSRGALQARWGEFLRVSVPFFTRVIGHTLRGGTTELRLNAGSLAREARQGAEQLGPTYVKAGQMLSARPDVLPQEALIELSALQDGVTPFDTATAVAIIEDELGQPFDKVFSDISAKPVAAASLAQVYRATLRNSRQCVAVKVQRPNIRATVSKDLYVLRRAAEVYQGLMNRFAPQQRTDYVALFNEWAIGFYTELDFCNEAKNQKLLKHRLQEHGITDVYIPIVYEELSSRRLLITEWVDGRKLSECPSHEIKELIGVGQEAFLTQLLQIGVFHADPHPGNLLKLDDSSKGKLALLDFGLVANLQQKDIDRVVNAIIHLANRDYASLIDDFIELEILPKNCNRSTILPLMDKALSPYVKGGGAQRYEAELRRTYGMGNGFRGNVGGFSAMTRDALTVLNDVPFSIPPYFALLGRAIVTLEGIALQGDPDYGLILNAYPFVARTLLREDRPLLQKALQDALYKRTVENLETDLPMSRLSSLINSALGVVARDTNGIFVDLDVVPQQGVSFERALRFLLSEDARSLRLLLRKDADHAIDVLVRQAVRKWIISVAARGPRWPTAMSSFIPRLEDLPIVFLFPSCNSLPSPFVSTLRQVCEAIFPPLSRQEEHFALALTDTVQRTLGPRAASIVHGDVTVAPKKVFAVLQAILSTEKGTTGQGLFPASLTRLLNLLLGAKRRHFNAKAGDPVFTEVMPVEIVQAVKSLSNEERASLFIEMEGIANRLGQNFLFRLSPLTKNR